MNRPGRSRVAWSVGDRVLLALAFLAVSPLIGRVLLMASWIWVIGIPTITTSGDDASIELSTLLALDGDLLVGPHSSYLMNQPGPSYLYLLAPFYAAAGRNWIGIVFGAMVINLVAAMALLEAARRSGERWLVGAVAALLAVHGSVSYGLLAHPNNSVVPLVAYTLALILAARLANGHLWAMPGLLAAASFAVQTHASSGLSLVGAGLLALALCGRPGPRARLGMPSATVGGKAALVATALVGLAFWLPPVVEELLERPGNLSRFATWALTDAGPRTPHDPLVLLPPLLVAHVQGVLNGYRQPLEFPSPLDPGVLSAALLGLVLAAMAVGARQRLGHAVALGLMLTVGLGAALVSLGRLPDSRPLSYLAWIWMLGLLGWALGLGVLGGSAATIGARRLSLAPVGLGLCAALVLASTWHSATILARSTQPGLHPESQDMRDLHDALSAELAERGIARPLVHVAAGPAASYILGNSLVMQRHKAGGALGVEGDEVILFGRSLRANGSEDGYVLLSGAPLTDAELKAYRPVRLIAANGWGAVYVGER